MRREGGRGGEREVEEERGLEERRRECFGRSRAEMEKVIWKGELHSEEVRVMAMAREGERGGG